MNTTQTRPTPAAGPFRPLSPLARAILADWDDPGLSELALAARHGLTIEALHAQARSPAFRAALAAWRALREDRLPFLNARSEALAARVLTALASREPDSQAAAKEVRLATKDLLRLLAPCPRAGGAGGNLPPDRPEADPSCGADLQSASRAQPEPPETPPSTRQPADSPSLTLRARQDPGPPPAPAPGAPPSGGVGAAAPTQQITPESRPELTPDASALRSDEAQDAPRSEERSTPPSKPTTPTFKPKSKRGYKSRPKPRSR
jgi:hypothetical protein